MCRKNTNIAIILAGGSGNRFDSDIPKQLYKINNKAIIEYSIEVFEKCSSIDDIWIVMNPNYIEDMYDIVRKNGYRKVSIIIEGGEERYYSTLNAVNQCVDDEANLIFHDAARPNLSLEIVDNVVDALRNNDAVAVAVPSTDTVFKVDNEGFIEDVPIRKSMFLAQTPQAFKAGIIREAYRRFLLNPTENITDDCGIVNRYHPETRIKIVLGNKRNIKITTLEDTKLVISD